MLIYPIALSADSFVASVMLSPLMSWRRRVLLATAFGACDFAASLASARFATLLPREIAVVASAVLMLIYGAAIWMTGSLLPRCQKWLFALPVLLSVDNLTLAVHPEQAVSFGVTSLVLAFGGMVIGALIPRSTAGPVMIVGAIALLSS